MQTDSQATIVPTTGRPTPAEEHGTALYGANPLQAWKRFITKYVTFSGRASRSEFWWWLLAFVVISVVLAFVNKAMVPAPTSADPSAVLQYSLQVSLLQLAWALVNFVGGISLTVRRLHDIGLSGGWWFVQLVPGLGSLAMIVMVALPTSPNGARFDRAAR